MARASSIHGFVRSLSFAAVLLCMGSALAGPLSALTGSPAKPASSSEPEAAVEEKVAPDSPRASLTEYFRWVRAGDYTRAARYLELTGVSPSDGPLLAKRLQDVLDRHLWIELDTLSPASHGNEDDGLAIDREDLGSVPGAAGKPEPVIIVRRTDKDGARWVFAASTVSHIDSWYEHLENRWLLEHLPKWALRVGPHELRWWQCIALVPLLFVAWCLSFAINRLAWVLIKGWLPEHGAETARKLHGPAKLAWTIVAAYALLPWLSLYEPADEFVRRGLSAAFLVAFFWALWKAVELSQHAVGSALWAKSSPTSASILTFGARVGKLVVAAFAFVAVLAELGYPVASIITGLGIGGIALALAAQKTVENLFGAFSLAVDQPFREGDTVTVDSITGTVETIGLRSTRIRTVERSLITIPNGKLAEMRIETLSARDRLRLYFVIGLAHTDGATLSKIVHGIEALLRASALLVPDSASVRLIALTDSAMNIEVAAMLQTTDNAVFLAARQGFLLDIVELVEREEAALAHPVSSIQLTEPNKAS